MDLSFGAVVFRLFLAALSGGYLGMNRTRRNRPAGFRTYLLVCVGAAITMMLGEYLYYYYLSIENVTVDVSRIGAQVISGVGFLGTGTIIVTSKQEIQGLSTAAGLWAAACLGLAIGVGNYVCAVGGFILIMICFQLLRRLEQRFLNNCRDMNLYLELDKLTHVHDFLNLMREKNIQIFEIEVLSKKETERKRPTVMLSVRLNKRQNHAQLLASLSDNDYVLWIDEI